MNDSDYNPRKRHVVFQKLNITPSSMPIISLIASIKNVRANGLDLSPDYQRGYIWSNEYKDQLILSIILNYPIGNIVINNLDQPNQRNARQELVDGKQRLTTIFRFMEVGNVGQWLDSYDDWFQLSKKTSDQAKEIIDRIVGDSDPDGLARMHRAKRLAFSDLPSSIQMNFNTYNIPVYTMQAADPAQIRNYFKVLQNQEKLRAGEIINAPRDFSAIVSSLSSVSASVSYTSPWWPGRSVPRLSAIVLSARDRNIEAVPVRTNTRPRRRRISRL